MSLFSFLFHRKPAPTPNVNDAVVAIYVKRYWPGWHWTWTTVGNDGRPQVLVTRNWKQRHQWHLIQQKDITLKHRGAKP